LYNFLIKKQFLSIPKQSAEQFLATYSLALNFSKLLMMPTKDIAHDTVKKALEKNNWTITHDPFYIQLEEIDLYIDLAAEKMLAAEKNGQRIAVEIKSFLGSSTITEFHHALGQFLNYRLALSVKEPEYQLYLAVPVNTYNSFFQRQLPRLAVREYQLKLIVYRVHQPEIIKWIN
jgi:CRISPR/Cas system-associated exonuclease Cas4 (RecB family)